MIAFKDAASLYEAHNDDLALVDLSKLTVVPALQAALTYTKGPVSLYTSDAADE